MAHRTFRKVRRKGIAANAIAILAPGCEGMFIPVAPFVFTGNAGGGD